MSKIDSLEKIERMMRLSRAVGAPVQDLLKKLRKVLPVLDSVLVSQTKNPREMMILLSMYYVMQAVKYGDDNKTAHEVIAELASTLPSILEMTVCLIEEED